MADFTIAILAGGKSSRMGRNKALLDIAGKPILAQMLERLKNLPAEIILIANNAAIYQDFALPTFPDAVLDKGPVAGIQSALVHSQHDFVAVLACDMPFVNPDLLAEMFKTIKTSESDAIVPRFQERPQVLHAIYKKTALKTIETALEKNELKLSRLLDNLKVIYWDEAQYQAIDPKGLSFSNLNTPEDYAALQNQQGSE